MVDNKEKRNKTGGGVPYIYMYINITYINLRNWVIFVVTLGKSSSTEQMGLAEVEGFVNGLSPNLMLQKRIFFPVKQP